MDQERRNVEINRLITNLKPDDFSIFYSNFLKHEVAPWIGLLSLSEVKDDILMWGFYANGHRGVCLEFLASSTTPFFGRTLPVQYEEKYPLVNFFDSTPEEQIGTVLLTKSSHWKYEKEWRIIERRGFGVYDYPPELLTAVILGAEMSGEHKKLIGEWIKKGSVRPAVYEARLKNDEFGLDIVILD
jgi:hypothetical protein